MIRTRKIVRNIILGVTVSLLASCVRESVNNDIKIDRFENDILQFDNLSADQKRSFINKYQDVLSILNFSIKADSPAEAAYSIPASPIYKSFSADVKKRFSSDDTLLRDLSDLKKSYETLFAGTSFPIIKTFITPFNQSVVMTDTTLLIGLNHYLGSNHPMYGYFEEYQRINKEPSRIIYDVTEALVRNKFTNDSVYNDNTLLSDMLYEGFILYSTKMLLEDHNKGHVTGYSPHQVDWCLENEGKIWQKIISEDLLYSQSGVIKSKIMQPSPFVSVISMECPGRIGRWIGLRIIESYAASNNKYKDIQLIYSDLKTKNSQMILMESRYDGK